MLAGAALVLATAVAVLRVPATALPALPEILVAAYFILRLTTSALGTRVREGDGGNPMSAKFCPECGTPTQGAKFCPECGTSTTVGDATAAAPQNAPQAAEAQFESDVWEGAPDPVLSPVAAKTNKYRLTTERLLVEKGLVGKKADSLDLFRVKDVQVKKSMTHRARKRGDVQVNTTDVSTPALVLESILEPDTVAEQIRTLVRDARQRHNVGTREMM
jgi:uncharacterized Zn finger protein (UPF0148 family)